MKKIANNVWAALMAKKMLIALVVMAFYPLVGLILGVMLFNAFLGDFGLFVGAVISFGIMTMGVAAFGLIPEKGTSFWSAIFAVSIQLILTIIMTGMALSRLYQVSINVLTAILCVALIVSQIAMWWTVRHHDEAWIVIKDWLAKLFASQTPAGNSAGALNAPPANANTPNNATPTLGSGPNP